MAKGRFSLEHFATRANEAAFWEAWVGAVLSRCGLFTLHHPFTIAANNSEIALYTHTWDLDVSCDRSGPWQATEVKSVSIEFSNDPPSYPRPNALVCSAISHKRKHGQNKATERDFVLVSRSTGAILWVPPGTVLETRTITDHDRGQVYKALSTPKENLRGLKDYTEAIRRR